MSKWLLSQNVCMPYVWEGFDNTWAVFSFLTFPFCPRPCRCTRKLFKRLLRPRGPHAGLWPSVLAGAASLCLALAHLLLSTLFCLESFGTESALLPPPTQSPARSLKHCSVMLWVTPAGLDHVDPYCEAPVCEGTLSAQRSHHPTMHFSGCVPVVVWGLHSVPVFINNIRPQLNFSEH